MSCENGQRLERCHCIPDIVHSSNHHVAGLESIPVPDAASGQQQCFQRSNLHPHPKRETSDRIANGQHLKPDVAHMVVQLRKRCFSRSAHLGPLVLRNSKKEDMRFTVSSTKRTTMTVSRCESTTLNLAVFTPSTLETAVCCSLSF